MEKTREEILEKLKSKEPYSAATVLLEPLVEMDDFSIRAILRNIDNFTLATAMYGASGRVVKRFFENIADTLILCERRFGDVAGDGGRHTGSPAESAGVGGMDRDRGHKRISS